MDLFLVHLPILKFLLLHCKILYTTQCTVNILANRFAIDQVFGFYKSLYSTIAVIPFPTFHFAQIVLVIYIANIETD